MSRRYDARIIGTGKVGVGLSGRVDGRPLLRVVPNSEIVAELSAMEPELRRFWFSEEGRNWFYQHPTGKQVFAGFARQFENKHGRLPVTTGDWQTLYDEFASKQIATDEKWIEDHTKIAQRRRALPGVATSDLAAQAARNALDDAFVDPEEIDGLFLGTVSPDHVSTPPTPALIAQKLGIGNRQIDFFETCAACSSFMVAFRQGAQAVMSGSCKTAVVIGADVMSTTSSPYSRSLYPILGDGGGAVVLRAEELGERAHFTPEGFASYTYPELADAIVRSAGGSRQPVTPSMVTNPFDQSHLIYMDGPRVRVKVIRLLLGRKGQDGLIVSSLTRAGFPTDTPERLATSLRQIDVILLHQANGIINADAEEGLRNLGYQGAFYNNIARLGNTTSASIPLLLHEARQQRIVTPGKRVMAIVFGGGFTVVTGIWVQ